MITRIKRYRQLSSHLLSKIYSLFKVFWFGNCLNCFILQTVKQKILKGQWSRHFDKWLLKTKARWNSRKTNNNNKMKRWKTFSYQDSKGERAKNRWKDSYHMASWYLGQLIKLFSYNLRCQILGLVTTLSEVCII